MSVYSQIASSVTPQSQPEGNATVKNRAGGFVFGVDKWTQLDRFLVLGTEGNTYYASAKDQTFENVKCLKSCLAEDGPGTVKVIATISEAGRAVKQDPAIYALAIAAADKNEATRRAALSALPRVCRTATHLFSFIQDLRPTGPIRPRGWGPMLRKAVADWYNGKSADSAAYQAVKYQNRDGWSHKDVLRLAHPKSADAAHNALYRWIVSGVDGFDKYKHRPIVEHSYNLPEIVKAFEMSKKAGSAKDVVNLINRFDLPHECVMNDFKDSPEVWEALLPKMGATALIRNLGKMSKIGLINKPGDAANIVMAKLSDSDFLRKGRVHPMQVLLAMTTYASGHGFRGTSSWTVSPQIVDALDGAFYACFGNIVPTGKRVLLALDVSGSMGSGAVANTNISARTAAAAMSMSFLRSEKNVRVVSFSGDYNRPGHQNPRYGWTTPQNTRAACEPLDITPKRRLDDICKYLGTLPFGPTDCAQPMLYVINNKLDVDAIVIMTDNETWNGLVHPHVALEQLRQRVGHNVSLAACAFTATGYSIADETDASQMNCVGLDGALPQVLSDFIRSNGEVAS